MRGGPLTFVLLAVALAACGDGPSSGGVIDADVVYGALQACMGGASDEGIATLDSALVRVPGSVDALTTRGLCYWTRADASGDRADAQRAYDDLSAAIAVYEDGRESALATPLDRIYSHRAFVARALDPDDWTRTLADLNAAIDVAPRHATHVLDRAVVHTYVGDTTAARADLRRFLSLASPTDTDRREMAERMLTDLGGAPASP